MIFVAVTLVPTLIVLGFGTWSSPVLAVPLLGMVVMFITFNVTPADKHSYGETRVAPMWAKFVQWLSVGGWLASLGYAVWLGVGA